MPPPPGVEVGRIWADVFRGDNTIKEKKKKGNGRKTLRNRVNKV
jgi:hypothetical protein